MIKEFFAASAASLCFSLLFNVSLREVFFCGITGGIGWIIYKLCLGFGTGTAVSVFIASLVITSVSRIFANLRKNPVTVFLISGIIPLVPGAGIYYTLFNIVTSNNYEAALKGIETMKIAGAISIAIIIILSLPRYFFTFGNKNYFDKKNR